MSAAKKEGRPLAAVTPRLGGGLANAHDYIYGPKGAFESLLEAREHFDDLVEHCMPLLDEEDLALYARASVAIGRVYGFMRIARDDFEAGMARAEKEGGSK